MSNGGVCRTDMASVNYASKYTPNFQYPQYSKLLPGHQFALFPGHLPTLLHGYFISLLPVHWAAGEHSHRESLVTIYQVTRNSSRNAPINADLACRKIFLKHAKY